MTRKTRVGILFGGKSAEHEVSLQSAKSIVDAIDKYNYDVILIGIDKAGQWYLNDASTFLLNADNPKLIALNKSNEGITLVPGADSDKNLMSLSGAGAVGAVDVVFPVLHEPYGEDGAMQGLFKLANIPFVGAGVLGAAISMDKDVMKRLLKAADIPTPNCIAFEKSDSETSHSTILQRNSVSLASLNRRISAPRWVFPRSRTRISSRARRQVRSSMTTK